MWRLRSKRFAALAVAAAVVVGFTPLARADSASKGWRVVATEKLADGVVHLRLERGGDAQQVHVARVSPTARWALRPVLSHNKIAEDGARLERTSAMCQRSDCLLGVNGDFADPQQSVPIGGLVISREMVRSFRADHPQISLLNDGTFTTAKPAWTGTVARSDGRHLTIKRVNTARTGDGLVLYTSRFGPNTRTARNGAELIAEIVSPKGPIKLGHPATVRVVKIREHGGSSKLAPGRFVLSGRGQAAGALRSLRAAIRSGKVDRELAITIKMQLERPVLQSAGGSPLLVRDGKRWVADDGSNFVAGRHPRTMIGWTEKGDLLLVTADGRQPGRAGGLDLLEAADLMLQLGAVDALNLDGGGSTTFVVKGHVRNQPSDGYERGVATALVLVEKPAPKPTPPPPGGTQPPGTQPPIDLPDVPPLGLPDDPPVGLPIGS